MKTPSSTEIIAPNELSFESLQSSEALIFLHLLKTGGTSLFRLLRQHYREEVTFHYSQKPEKTLDYFDNLPQEKRDQLKFLHGHLHFGFHKRLRQPSRYITMLRKPVNRIVSQYFFLHQNPNRYLPEEARCKTLQEYLDLGLIELDNDQTRRIAGDISHSFKFGECTSDLLDIAKQNLTQCLMVGITERFDESLIVLKHALGLENILYSRFNENFRRPRLEEIDARQIELIQTYNQLDEELYRYGNMLLNEAIQKIGDRFHIEYQFFRQANIQFADTQTDLVETRAKLRRTKKKLKQVRKHRKELRKALNHTKASIELMMQSKFWRFWQGLIRLNPSKPDARP